MYYVLYYENGEGTYGKFHGPFSTTQEANDYIDKAQNFDQFTDEICEYFITQKLGE